MSLQSIIAERTSNVDEEEVLHFIHVTSIDGSVARSTKSREGVNSTHIKSTSSPLSPFSFIPSNRLCVLDLKQVSLGRTCCAESAPIREVTLTPLPLNLLISFEHCVIPVRETFIGPSVESAVWEL